MDFTGSIVESFLAAGVVLLQLRAFQRSRAKAERLGRLFPAQEPMSVVIRDSSDEAVRLESPPGCSPQFESIILATNEYLHKNVGHPADFGILRDIVERASNEVEDDTEADSGLPLYIGLMGTFIGVVVGLFGIAFDPQSSISDRALHRFLGGVLVAMCGSFVGLLLTVILRSRYINPAIAINSGKKRLYLSWMQSELLPAIGHTVTQALMTLQHSLLRFNKEFGVNIERFQGALTDASENLDSQREMLRTLRSANLASIIKANSMMISNAEQTSRRLSEFVSAVDTMQGSMMNIGAITVQVQSLIDRVKRFENSVNGLGDKLAVDATITGRTVSLIDHQIRSITDRSELIRQFAEVQDDQLREYVQEHKQKELKLLDAARQQMQALSEELSESLTEALGDRMVAKVQQSLEYLKSMDARLEALEKHGLQAPTRMQDRDLAQGFDQICKLLQQIETAIQAGKRPARPRWSRIARMFGSRSHSDSVSAKGID